MTFAFLMLASTACLALEPQPAIDWPPKAVPNQQKGKVPDFTGKNQLCLACHGYIMDVKTARKDIPNLHRRHLESKKVAYQGKNRDCLTCHEMWTPATDAREKEGWFVMADVYHPNTARSPAGVWKKLIVRADVEPNYATVEALRTADPYTYNPTLKRLVCIECHGPDSKIKTFYGAPQAAK
ncbi:MAG: hypothetical protein A3E57_09290 [Candidatus Muproteobacteria bacterium RIFCSPHIGHO2_12_FULL_60_33]|uniref:Cytochrome c-552/4 domain-containing protein n=1 Tax=Candidatus Muproteobacteria bacterium RIFCSPLOWO2_01_FULL_60_18 TaxID=1817768 RepID=A0A1F6TZM8_9PROT|nr:MAG: hypothetical protein A3A87_05620 [Candidatus Muproteobacteria bacterium RIFCSPLOWO2_01_FULL_60_18]OGI53196.1 MAG: hypothetical protein A2W42_06535 [Candidatus Muproteobacteria bacterium RIFCSPHIGHO2_01_60_12]OGI54995.1 MAG: hypothetical protein A3E57_09290 [Candidatus Muproteobacteria bacterium RIFCSPHIGHO2_12_FULL_60_33]OGI55676.1 MAG: hypothetical protein A3D32_05205 [Candidatus Muproteobacteria bacterium RIFCSPHIGHO2_02_FULL_60_13]OGI59339.1 MAG: hypothetical protein A2809_06635 [Can